MRCPSPEWPQALGNNFPQLTIFRTNTQDYKMMTISQLREVITGKGLIVKNLTKCLTSESSQRAIIHSASKSPKDSLAVLLFFFFSSNKRSTVLKLCKSWYKTHFFAERAMIATMLNFLLFPECNMIYHWQLLAAWNIPDFWRCVCHKVHTTWSTYHRLMDK